MKSTQKEVRDAILLIAKSFGRGSNYEYLITSVTLPELIRMIAYEIFLNKFDPRSCKQELFDAYKLIHETATELQEVGYITFE